MEENKKKRVVTIVFMTILVAFPIGVAFFNVTAGAVLLLISLFIMPRALAVLRHDSTQQSNSPSNTQDRAGTTIFVQIVDDFGRDLPPDEVKRRMAEAHSKAGPRDTVAPVKFKVEKKMVE